MKAFWITSISVVAIFIAVVVLAGGWYLGLFLFAAIVPLFFYFLPALIAWERGLKNALSITLLNLFLGWTLVGWVVAICLASMGTAAKRA